MLSKYYLGKNKLFHYAVATIPLIMGSFPLILVVLGGGRAKFGNGVITLPEALVIELVMASVSAAMFLLPKFMLSSELDKLNLRLPYIVLKMKTMVSAGEPPLKAFEEVVKDVKLGILDLILKEIMLGTPPADAVDKVQRMIGKNPAFDVLKRVMTAIEMGGESTSMFLKDEFEGLMSDKEAELKKALNNLSVIVEIYMSMGVFAPVLGIIMLSSLSILSGADVTPLITLLVFVAIPIFSVFSAIMAKKLVERALL